MKPRPFKVFYSGGVSGNCSTIKTALTSAARRIFRGEAKRANIYLEGVHIADADRVGDTVVIWWQRDQIGKYTGKE
jgi:hypothetical protein